MGEWGKDDISLSSQMPNNFSLRVNQLTSEMTSAFSNMCTRLIAITAQKKIIQERTLLDFNRFVIFTITNNITQLPNSFCELSTRIADYWHYELDRETDSDRKYSYIRLYQTSSVCIYKIESNQVYKIIELTRCSRFALLR